MVVRPSRDDRVSLGDEPICQNLSIFHHLGLVPNMQIFIVMFGRQIQTLSSTNLPLVLICGCMFESHSNACYLVVVRATLEAGEHSIVDSVFEVVHDRFAWF